jgi:DNA polymerase-3 subunit beta
MEINLSKKDLLNGLEKTLSVVERRNTMPSLNHALLDVKDETLQISATDLEIFVSSSIPCRTLLEGRIAVPARNLYDIVKESDDKKEIFIKVTESNRVEIRSGKSFFKLMGLSADNFPHFKTSPKGQLSAGKLKTKEFLRLLQQTEHCICNEEYRYALTGIYFESLLSEDGHGQVLKTTATDGHRLALMESPVDKIGNLDLKKGLIIPKKGAVELRKLLESTEEDTFELTCDENLLRAHVGVNKLWIRPIDSEYPDCKRVIPKGLPSKLTVDKKELLTGLRRMSLLVSDRSMVVTFDFKKDHVTLSTNNPDLGEAIDEIPAKFEGQEVKTGFNVRFFIEALNNFHGDKMEICLGEKLQPALLKSVDDPGFQIVIMPMRL